MEKKKETPKRVITKKKKRKNFKKISNYFGGSKKAAPASENVMEQQSEVLRKRRSNESARWNTVEDSNWNRRHEKERFPKSPRKDQYESPPQKQMDPSSRWVNGMPSQNTYNEKRKTRVCKKESYESVQSWFNEDTLLNFHSMINSLFDLKETNTKLKKKSKTHLGITNLLMFLISQQLISFTNSKNYASRQRTDKRLQKLYTNGRTSLLTTHMTYNGEPDNKAIAKNSWYFRELLLASNQLDDTQTKTNLMKLLRGLSDKDSLDEKYLDFFNNPNGEGQRSQGVPFYFPCSVREAGFMYGQYSNKANLVKKVENDLKKTKEKNSKKIMAEELLNAECVLFVTDKNSQLPSLQDVAQRFLDASGPAGKKLGWEAAHLFQVGGDTANWNDIVSSFIGEILFHKMENSDSDGFSRLLAWLYSETFPAGGVFNDCHTTLLRATCVDGPLIGHIFSSEFNFHEKENTAPDPIRLILFSFTNKLSKTIGFDPVNFNEFINVLYTPEELKHLSFLNPPKTDAKEQAHKSKQTAEKIQEIVPQESFNTEFKKAEEIFDQLIEDSTNLINLLIQDSPLSNLHSQKIPFLIFNILSKEIKEREKYKKIIEKMRAQLVGIKNHCCVNYAYAMVLYEILDKSMLQRQQYRKSVGNNSIMANSYLNLKKLLQDFDLDNHHYFINTIKEMQKFDGALFTAFMIYLRNKEESKGASATRSLHANFSASDGLGASGTHSGNQPPSSKPPVVGDELYVTIDSEKKLFKLTFITKDGKWVLENPDMNSVMCGPNDYTWYLKK